MDAVGTVKFLCSHYGRNNERIPMRPPFEELICTVLSQQTTRSNCERAAEKLFSVYRTPQEMASADLRELEELVRSSGYYRMKAKAVKDICTALVDRFGGEVPDTMEELVTLPRVGTKTAACVLMYGFGKPAMVVDTHIHRVANRLRLADSADAHGTEEQLSEKIPQEMWEDTDFALLSLGHDCCHARNPECGRCPMEECPSRTGFIRQG